MTRPTTTTRPSSALSSPSATKTKTTAALLLLAATAALVVLPSVAAAAASSSSSASAAPTSSSGNARPLRFSSPVQSYTVFDKGATTTTTGSPRSRFLARFRTGLAAERGVTEALADERRRGIVDFDLDDDVDDDDETGGGWAEASAAADERRKKAAERRLEEAYDAAVGDFDERVAVAAAARKSRQQPAIAKSSSGSGYQFVGVVNDGHGGKGDGSDVTWYARKKPRKSRWNVRLLHVNRDAVLRDLFVKGKVDLYGKYVNEGLDEEAAAFAAADDGSSSEGGEDDPPGMRPLIAGRYDVRERSWRTLWNFSPVRMFATPSGSFWRERRIEPGLYTDGDSVYESVYRYRDGRNGLKPVAKLDRFLSSNTLGYEEKMRVVERLKGGDGPDVVVEK